MLEKQYLRLIPFIFLSSSLPATDCSPRRKYSLTGTISSKSEIPKFDTDEILDKTVRSSFPTTIDLLSSFSHYFCRRSMFRSRSDRREREKHSRLRREKSSTLEIGNRPEREQHENAIINTMEAVHIWRNLSSCAACMMHRPITISNQS